MPRFGPPPDSSDEGSDDEKWDDTMKDIPVLPQQIPQRQTVSPSPSQCPSYQYPNRSYSPESNRSQHNQSWKRSWQSADITQSFRDEFPSLHAVKRRKLENRRDMDPQNVWDTRMELSSVAAVGDLRNETVQEELMQVFAEVACVNSQAVKNMFVDQEEGYSVRLTFWLDFDTSELREDGGFESNFRDAIYRHHDLSGYFWFGQSDTESMDGVQIPEQPPIPVEPLQRVHLKRKQKRTRELFPHGHFRCAFGPLGRMVKCSRAASGAYSVEITTVSNGTLDIPEDIHKAILHQSFQIHHELSTGEKQSLAAVCDKFQSLYRDYETHERIPDVGRLQLRQMSLAWKLTDVFWRELNHVDADSEYGKQYFRRMNFDDWLRTATELEVAQQLADCNDPTERIFLYLSCNKKTEAVQECFRIRNFRLATIISGGDQKRLQEQVKLWRERGNWDTFPPGLRKTYLLLAGQLEQSVVEDMDWLQYLHVLANYFLARNASVAEIINVYRGCLKKSLFGIETPKPTFSFVGNAVSVLFSLMEVYTRNHGHLDVNPLTTSNSSLDVSFLWFLSDTLTEQNICFVNRLTTRIYKNFTEQLEQAGIWDQAIYVSLASTRYEKRFFNAENVCRRLLVRYFPQVREAKEARRRVNQQTGILGYLEASKEEEEETEVSFAKLQALGVRDTWIAEATALLAFVDKDWERALEHYLLAEKFQKANEIFCSKVLPRWMLDREYDRCREVFTSLEENSFRIDDWDSRGKIYKGFFDNVPEEIDLDKDIAREGDFEEHRQNLLQLNLDTALQALKPTEIWEKVLVAKMLEVFGELVHDRKQDDAADSESNRMETESTEEQSRFLLLQTYKELTIENQRDAQNFVPLV